MPKRTNDFQQLIALIYSQIKPTVATIAESVLLKERGSETEREVDILLECSIAGTHVRIAVECRRKGRKNDIKWIDELIGKYRDLDVAKVIAVSNQLYSDAAVQKAKANRIDTLTLRQALHTDWTRQLVQLGMARTIRQDVLKKLRVVTNPPPACSPLATDTVTTADGIHVGTLTKVALTFFDASKEKLSEEIRQRFLELFRTVADISSRSIKSDLTFTPPTPLLLNQADGMPRSIEQVILTVESTITVEPVDVSAFVLGDVRVSQAVMQLDEHDNPLTVTALQTPDRPGQIQVAFRPLKTANRKNTAKRKNKRHKAQGWGPASTYQEVAL